MNLPVRLRRLRTSTSRRAMFQEVELRPHHLVQPYFVVPGTGIRREVKAGTGLVQISSDLLVEEIRPLEGTGVGGVMLFGVPDTKSDYAADMGALPTQLAPLLDAIARSKKALPDFTVFADVCLCSYTSSGHCGVVDGHTVKNDESVAVLAEMAVQLAQAGVDFVSPSDMMDGRVGAIRQALDQAGHTDTGILAYAIKMASAYYGPFRHAADSAPQFGDRKTYQMPPTNRREALREIAADVAEGADALLIKPALTNLDLLRDARERHDHPLFAYQVSGEYAMLRAAADAGLIDFDAAMLEALYSMRRAGADVIISYYTPTFVRTA